MNTIQIPDKVPNKYSNNLRAIKLDIIWSLISDFFPITFDDLKQIVILKKREYDRIRK